MYLLIIFSLKLFESKIVFIYGIFNTVQILITNGKNIKNAVTYNRLNTILSKQSFTGIFHSDEIYPKKRYATSCFRLREKN